MDPLMSRNTNWEIVAPKWNSQCYSTYSLNLFKSEGCRFLKIHRGTIGRTKDKKYCSPEEKFSNGYRWGSRTRRSNCNQDVLWIRGRKWMCRGRKVGCSTSQRVTPMELKISKLIAKSWLDKRTFMNSFLFCSNTITLPKQHENKRIICYFHRPSGERSQVRITHSLYKESVQFPGRLRRCAHMLCDCRDTKNVSVLYPLNCCC
ncbi:uncharacterized protein LOC129624595 isoform X3 [Bubalus kerabau]|uniref:uncharacterized protein LOC129624595 isoform X3 n=1 Tax=Bubalus carabanensis TaxID=3119969 RepID=UPI000DBC71AB|nr:uncharacterized protein LOC129624595 isoform X3 [Bubalus carabanensis]